VLPLNLPNVLTVLRIVLVPVLVVALAVDTKWGNILAVIVFSLASATDALDGYIARARNEVTTFGKLMDPLADKLLIIAALVTLVARDEIAAWVAMVIIARDLAVTGLRTVAQQQGVVIAASAFGKVKTVMQVLMVILLIAITGRPLWLDLYIYATVAVTVISGLDYFFGLRKRLEEARRHEAAAKAAKAGAERT
jgi:CDP-diacylglycerol--glycerol-3-phosphate 3-phosphatidyltransferase